MSFHLNRKQRIVSIGVASLLIGLAVAWHFGFSLFLGQCVLLGVFLVYIRFKMLNVDADEEEITNRYRRLDGGLPCITCRKTGIRGSLGRSREVIAVYADQLVLINVKVAAPSPWEIFSDDGAAELVKLPHYGAPRVFRVTEIGELCVHRARVFSRSLTFTGRTNQTSFRFRLPAQDGEVILEALAGLLGERIRTTSDTPQEIRRNRIRAMLAICAGLDLAAVLYIWVPPMAGDARVGMRALATIREGLGLLGSAALLAYLLLLVNSLLMFIAARDPSRAGSTGET